MNAEYIENSARNILEQILLECPNITYDIKINDKTPSWDGTIFLYKDRRKKKSDLICKCEIQLKGKRTLGKNKTYAIEVSDLINYKNHGGVIFFVVDIGIKKVFYSELLPIKIGRMFKNNEKVLTQKTLTVPLDEFPSNVIVIEQKIRDFCKHSDMQRLTKGEIFDVARVVDTFSSGSTLLGSLSIIKEGDSRYLNNIDSYIYKLNLDGTVLPIDLIRIEQLMHKELVNIFINDNYMFQGELNRIISHKNDESCLLINNNICINYSNNTRNANLKFKLEGKLFEIEQSCQILKHLLSGDKIKLGNWAEFSTSNFTLENFHSLYKEFMAIYAAAKFLRIDVNTNFNNFTQDDCNKLLWIAERLNNGECPKPAKKIQYSLERFKFSFFEVVVLVKKEENSEIEVFDPFLLDLSICYLEDPQSIMYPLFVSFDQEWLCSVKNIDYEKVLKTIEVFDIKNDSLGILTNFILEGLRSVDIAQNTDLLMCIEVLAKRLYEMDKSILHYVNYLQCIKRQRNITDEEAEILLNKADEAEGSEKDLINCAISLLLNDKYRYKLLYKQLSQDLKEQFDNYPIKFLETLLT